MVGGFIRKVVSKVQNVAEKCVGKVKSLASAGAEKVTGAVSAGAGKVKGAVTAGVGKVKSGVAAGASNIKSRMGIGEEKPSAPTTDESEKSTAVKGKARALVNQKAKRPFQSQQEADKTLGDIKKQLEPQGLKSLHLKPRNGQPGKFDVIAEASAKEDVGDITIEIPSILGVSKRIDSVEEAQKAREQWIMEGKAYRESLRTELFQEEWAIGLQQEGPAPPAYVDSAQILNIDTARVGRMSSERTMELQSIRRAGKGASSSPSGSAPAAPTATRETTPPMAGPSGTPTVKLPEVGATKRETESSMSDTVEMPAVGGTKRETASSMSDTVEMPAVGSSTSAATGPVDTPTRPNMPAVGGGAQQLVVVSKSSDYYYVYDPIDPKQRLVALGRLDDGFITAHIRNKLEGGLKSKLIRGHEQFAKILTHFGSAKGFKASWQFGTNLEKFNELTGKDMKPEAAARETWTGEQCKLYGFDREVKVDELVPKDSPGAYTKVIVYFLK